MQTQRPTNQFIYLTESFAQTKSCRFRRFQHGIWHVGPERGMSRFRGRRLGGLLKRKITTMASHRSDFHDLEGIYIRDEESFDAGGYERVLDLLQLDRLQRLTALQLVEGLKVEVTEDSVRVKWLTVVPFFQISEIYKFDATTLLPRRDLRPGGRRASAHVDADGILHLTSSWSPPNPGNMEERLVLSEDRQHLTIEINLVLESNGAQQSCKVNYVRTPSWKPRFHWNPFEAARILAGGAPRISRQK